MSLLKEKIELKRLYIRNFLTQDISENYLKGLNNNIVVGLTEARHKDWDMHSARNYIENASAENNQMLIGAFLKSTDKHIGNIHLHTMSLYHKRVELGILLHDPTEWGKGYGTEFLLGVCKHVFLHLELRRICADYYSINKASARLFEKTGFEVEGIFKNHFFIKDRFCDSIRVAKLNEMYY